MKTILAPVDFSPVTARVVAYASALARALDGRVVLMNVTQPVYAGADFTAFVQPIAQINDIAAKSAVRQLSKFEEELEREFLKVDTIQLTGSPVRLILDEAEKLPADYIVIGSHGHTAFYDLLVGSTASGILKRAVCPVVVVPPEKKPRKPRRQARSASLVSAADRKGPPRTARSGIPG